MVEERTFEGAITITPFKQGDSWQVAMGIDEENGVTMDLEEAAVLAYQLQQALRFIQQQMIDLPPDKGD